MPRPSSTESRRDRRRLGAGAIATLTVAACSGTAVALLTGLALAKGPTTLGVAKNVKVKAKTESIVVDSKGLTVYVLTPETANSRLCTASNGCLLVWPPVKVDSAHAKLSAAPGVKGKLGITHKFGVFQVTLDGHPLYLFSFDHKTKGSAKGEGIAHFGGVWHVLKASATSHAPTHTTTTTTTSTTMTSTSSSSTTTGPYGY